MKHIPAGEEQLPIEAAEISASDKTTIEQNRSSLKGTRKIRVAFCQHFWYEYIGPMALSAQLKNQGDRKSVV